MRRETDLIAVSPPSKRSTAIKPSHPADQCMYAPLGKCCNRRTVKQNGKLHSLCAYHREKQNANQRKRDSKLRRLKLGHATGGDQAALAPPTLLLPYANNSDEALAATRRMPFLQRLPPIRSLIRLLRQQEPMPRGFYPDGTAAHNIVAGSHVPHHRMLSPLDERLHW
ncbi:hypothetical protein H310_06628 [Aphanomyces invadans]|uniref:Uncharacterized protein n=1 Tax=Aphanomyces invadans TaxID=157072 RepID=A0A024U446_9STRA|nr:hypothetical protein H310_06628 [Aphanomyces invadans]ETW00985.1 hypothetical protein H310_06628 [Aphanomyces invadans]|eukprot:XP_008869983.1 hypothetical protein H310_06628 [Aphanomyces invadans]